MNILFISNNLPPTIDGVGDYTYNIAKEFAIEGHDTHIVCSNRYSVKTYNKYGIDIKPIIDKWNQKAGIDIVRIIKQFNIEIVSLQYVPHGFEKHGLPFGLIYTIKKIKKTNVKFFTFFHEVYIGASCINIKYYIYDVGIKFISKKIAEMSDFAITSIDNYKERIKSLTNNKDIHILPIVSNVPEYSYPIHEIKKLRCTIAADDEIIITFFGQRNIEKTLSLIEELINEGYRIKVLLLGKTQKNETLYIQRTGVLDIHDIYKYLLVSDFMILPESSKNGCSYKSGSLASAFRAGIPVITSKGCLTDKELINDVNVKFCDFNNNNSIKKAIIELTTNNIGRKAIGHNAKQLFRHRTWKQHFIKYQDIIALHY